MPPPADRRRVPHHPRADDPVSLLGKLTADAATRHIAAGEEASVQFDLLLKDRLTRPTGTQRPVATIPTGEVIDRYGRMLAYLAPWYTGGATDPLPPKDDPRRRTFKLDMVTAGWAASFIIYPRYPTTMTSTCCSTRPEQPGRRSLAPGTPTGPGCCSATSTVCVSSWARPKRESRAWPTPSSESASTYALDKPKSVGLVGWAKVPPPDRMWCGPTTPPPPQSISASRWHRSPATTSRRSQPLWRTGNVAP